MKLTLHRLTLPLEHPFTIARGTLHEQASLVVALEHDGYVGLGEVTENPYYGHTIESMTASLERVRSLLPQYAEESPEVVWPRMLSHLSDDRFALSALDMAAHDLASQRRGLPLYQHWGLAWERIADSSFTIGIDTIEKMKDKLRERPGWPIYKIKLGTDHDLEIVRQLRGLTDAIFRVDANCGWNARQAIEYSRQLAALNVEFIEQPLPADASDADQRAVFAESALPIVADENCLVESDVARCEGRFHGINVKLCKCGGLTPAMRMLREARLRGMKTMVGCMVESSVGISAAAHLLPLLDYADLDGAILLSKDPAAGVTIQQGRVQLANSTGTGARLVEQV